MKKQNFVAGNTKYNCKKIFPFRDNSFLQIKIYTFKEYFKIVQFFFDFKLNINGAFNYLQNIAHLKITKRNIRKFYYEIRNAIIQKNFVI